MKILGREISIFRRVTEKFKGKIDIGYSTKPKRRKFFLGEHSWLERCKRFDQLYERHPLVKQALLSLGGQLIAEGIYLQPADNSEQAKELVDVLEELNRRLHLKTMIFETGKTIGKYGSCFWEKTWDPAFDCRIIPGQEYIQPAEVDPQGNITSWRQVIHGREVATWQQNEIVHFAWDVTSQSWPYGTSLLVGLETELEIMEDIEQNSRDYMEKQAWPYEILQIGNGEYVPTEDEMASVKAKWKNRSVGENIVTSYPAELKQGGTGGAPIRELNEVLAFIKDNLQDGLILPAVSKLYNATEASARVLVSWASSCLIRPMQELIRIKIEEEVYKPYLEDLGYNINLCPTIYFEPPISQKKEDAEFWKSMVQAGICPPRVAAREFGWEDEWLEWQAEKEAKAQLIQQKQEENEVEEIYEVRYKGRKSRKGS